MTSTERGPLMPLEQRCVQPGYWLIEGHEVRRLGPGAWTVRDPGNYEFTARTLPIARALIRERLGK
jgi:hypothetical protein